MHAGLDFDWMELLGKSVIHNQNALLPCIQPASHPEQVNWTWWCPNVCPELVASPNNRSHQCSKSSLTHIAYTWALLSTHNSHLWLNIVKVNFWAFPPNECLFCPKGIMNILTHNFFSQSHFLLECMKMQSNVIRRFLMRVHENYHCFPHASSSTSSFSPNQFAAFNAASCYS